MLVSKLFGEIMVTVMAAARKVFLGIFERKLPEILAIRGAIQLAKEGIQIKDKIKIKMNT